MKWGVRRYQNPDGSLTPAGKKKARHEYKVDNATAFILGKNATISGHAAARSLERTTRIDKKLTKQYEKDPDGLTRRTKRLRDKWDASAKTSMELAKDYVAKRHLAEKHCKSLIDKYGEEAVSSIKYKDIKMPKSKDPDHISSFNTMNERTNTLSDYATSGAFTLASKAFATMLGSPISFIYLPSSAREKGAYMEQQLYRNNREQKR